MNESKRRINRWAILLLLILILLGAGLFHSEVIERLQASTGSKFLVMGRLASTDIAKAPVVPLEIPVAEPLEVFGPPEPLLSPIPKKRVRIASKGNTSISTQEEQVSVSDKVLSN